MLRAPDTKYKWPEAQVKYLGGSPAIGLFASAFRSLFASLPLAGQPRKEPAGFTYCLERRHAIGRRPKLGST